MWREFVELAEKRDMPFAVLCARFGVSRKTGYKWLNRFRTAGPAGLVAQSRRPKSSPRKTPEEVVAAVIALRREQPDWSAARLHAALQQQGVAPWPAPSTIDLILRRRREAVERHGPPAGAGAPAQPNDRWLCRRGAVIRCADRAELRAWLVHDDASGFILGSLPLAPGQEPNWTEWLGGCFRRHGLPWRIVLPGDPALRGEAPCRWHSSHSVRLMRWGIGVEFDFDPAQAGPAATEERRELAARLGALPSYQRAPLVERMAAVDPLQALSETAPPANAASAARWLEAWSERHNFGGRQEAMQRRAPVARYRPSERLLPAEPAGPRYQAGAEVRLVSEKGILTFQRRLVHVGRVFAGCEVELKPAPHPHRYEVRFAGQTLGRVDVAATGADETTSLPLTAV